MRRPSPVAAGAVGARREVREGCPGAAGGRWSLGSAAARVLPAAARRAVGGPGSRGVRCAPRAPAPVIQVEPWAPRAKFCCGFSLPASPPAPAPRASAGRRPLPTQAQGPAGRGEGQTEGGRACAHGAGLGGGPTSRELAPPSPPRPARRRTTPPTPGASGAPPRPASPRGGTPVGPPHLRRAERAPSIQFLGARLLPQA